MDRECFVVGADQSSVNYTIYSTKQKYIYTIHKRKTAIIKGHLLTNNFCHAFKGCWQITFVALNRFCLLSNLHPPPVHTHTHHTTPHHTTPFSLTDNIKMMDRILTKIKLKIHALFPLYFKFWRYKSLWDSYTATRSFVSCCFY